MQSYLYIGNNKEVREEAALKFARQNSKELDVHIYSTEEDNGIDTIREISKQIYLTPLNSKLSSILIFDSHNLTIPAQNALLKTLEEPPKFSQIILTASSPELLLPTVVSRCLMVTTQGNSTVNSKYQKLLIGLKEINYSEFLKLSETLELEEWLSVLREELRNSLLQNNLPQSQFIVKLLNNCFYSIKLSKYNVNKK